ncbi:hypothetical protein PGT21_026352 [Puccinia graminis f. sp. tritici]|uniref:Uncharacterized protein n=1 Tax=Puccinia graminis f. sp. tritici TaxID=56615 RepID=A0A5B0PLF1_PUCGR|nr:hypothetical protein PGT21_026352 [Puccinia graminis f. sp. tritici]
MAVTSAPLNKRTAQPPRAWCRSWIIVAPLVDIDMDLPLNASQSYNDAGVLDKPKKSIFFCWCSWRGNRRLRQLKSLLWSHQHHCCCFLLILSSSSIKPTPDREDCSTILIFISITTTH